MPSWNATRAGHCSTSRHIPKPPVASSSDSFNGAVVIGAEDVRRCWKILDQHFGEVSATAHCADGLTRDFTSLDALLEYDNSISREIHTLDVKGHGDGSESAHARWNMSATITISTFGSYSPTTPVEIRLACDEPDLHIIRRGLLELFGDAKVWFSVFVKIRMEFIYVGVLILLWMAARLMVPGETSGEGLPFPSAILGALLFMGVLALLGCVGFGLNKVQDRYFPKAVFTLGQGQKRFETDEKVRWGIFITGGVALMVGLVLWLMLPR